MKKLFLTLFVLVSAVSFLAAEEQNEYDATLKFGIGPFFSAAIAAATVSVNSMESFPPRFGVLVAGAYPFSKVFKAGVETGIGASYQYVADGGGDLSYADIPVRLFGAFSFGAFFAQLYGGYYFALINAKSFAGPEFGFKVGFFGVYLSGSFILAQVSNFRIGIGLLLGN